MLATNIEIGPVVSDKKTFKVLHIDKYGKLSLPLAAIFFFFFFLTNQDGLNNLSTGSPK